MSKRFIDTGLFDDEWFMELSKEAKILWVYFITKCDHAGILKLNTKLCIVQTGIDNLGTVIEQLGNRLVTVGEQLFFIPKFVEYQYPGFPECNFNMAKSAISILEKYGLIHEKKLTVPQELPNSYGNGNGNKKKGVQGEKTNPDVILLQKLDVPVEYAKMLLQWLKYKREKNQAYKNEKSLNLLYQKLLKYSDSDPKKMQEIIDQSMSNNWAGLFELKNKTQTKITKCPFNFVFGRDHERFEGCDTCERDHHNTWSQCKVAQRNYQDE